MQLAEEIRRRYPPAERVRLVSTGTEATMTAIRLARAATGRDVIVKFAGCYHGHSDALLVAAGSGLATAGVPDSAGVTRGAAGDTMVLPYGDEAALTDAFAEHGARIAAVITEAAPANMGVVRRRWASTASSRRCAATREPCSSRRGAHGVPRRTPGYWGVERDAPYRRRSEVGTEAWVPDLVTFGKVIGGGLPVAAVAGRTELMEQLAPLGGVYQAGTLSGNPVAVAAGIATLELLDDAAYATLADRADYLAEGLADAFWAAGRTAAIARAGTLMSVFLGLEAAPTTFDEAAWPRYQAFGELFHAWRGAGV